MFEGCARVCEAEEIRRSRTKNTAERVLLVRMLEHSLGFSFFFVLFLSFYSTTKRKKKDEKERKTQAVFQHPHEFTLVRLCFLFGYAESLQPRKLGHSPQTMLGKKLIQIFIHPHPPFRHLLPSRGKVDILILPSVK